MRGVVVQLNTSPGGVPKLPVLEARVNRLGIEGDGHAHPRFHGGPLKALLLISSEVLDDLVAQGFPVYAGALGENVTMRGVDVRSMRIGQRWRLGEVVVELTSVRVPCSQIGIYGEGIQNAIFDANVRSGDWSSPRWGMSGLYASVVIAGTIRPGDPIELLEESA